MFEGIISTIKAIFTGYNAGDGEKLAGSWQDQLLAMHNRQRSTPLAISLKLQASAQKHADWMAETATMSHTGNHGSSFVDRINAEGYSWSSIGENIAEGYPSEESVIKGWMGSLGHRLNILNKSFTEVGFGRAVNVKSGDVYWSADFGSPI